MLNVSQIIHTTDLVVSIFYVCGKNKMEERDANNRPIKNIYLINKSNLNEDIFKNQQKHRKNTI